MRTLYEAAPTSSDPLIPTWWESLVTLGGVLAAVVLLVALISLARTAKTRSATHTLGWFAALVLMPLLGPLLWFVTRRRDRRMSVS